MSYVITGPLVVTKNPDGTDLYLYEGAEIPDFVSDDECKRIADLGLAEQVKSAANRK